MKIDDIHISDHTASGLIREKQDVLRLISEADVEIVKLESRKSALQDDVEAIDRILTRMGYSHLIAKIRKKKSHVYAFPHGALSVGIATILKKHLDGMTVDDILNALSKSYPSAIENNPRDDIRKRILESLNRHHRLGRFRKFADMNGPTKWGLSTDAARQV